MAYKPHSLGNVARAALVASLFTATSTAAAAQISLSDVEVHLVRRPAGGCVTPCATNYSVTVRGDGTVEYEGSGLVEGPRTRSISPDDVVALVNEFLRVRFFNALDAYVACCSRLVRDGDTVALYGVGSADDPKCEADTAHRGKDENRDVAEGLPSRVGKTA